MTSLDLVQLSGGTTTVASEALTALRARVRGAVLTAFRCAGSTLAAISLGPTTPINEPTAG